MLNSDNLSLTIYTDNYTTMNTNYTNPPKKNSLEGVLLALLFIFGMLGFIYAFSNKERAKVEKVVTVQTAEENR